MKNPLDWIRFLIFYLTLGFVIAIIVRHKFKNLLSAEISRSRKEASENLQKIKDKLLKERNEEVIGWLEEAKKDQEEAEKIADEAESELDMITLIEEWHPGIFLVACVLIWPLASLYLIESLIEKLLKDARTSFYNMRARFIRHRAKKLIEKILKK